MPSPYRFQTVQPAIVNALVVKGPTGPTGPAGSSASATTNASQLTSGTLPDARLSTNVVKVSDMQTALTAKANEVAARTTDPGVANAGFDSWWNNGGVVTISSGIITFNRPDGSSRYLRPDGTSTYARA